MVNVPTPATPVMAQVVQPMEMSRGQAQLDSSSSAPNVVAAAAVRAMQSAAVAATAGQRRSLRRPAPADEPNLDGQMATAYSGCYIHEYCIYGTCIVINKEQEPMTLQWYGCCLCGVALPLPWGEMARAQNGTSQFRGGGQEFWFVNKRTLVNYGHELDDCLPTKDQKTPAAAADRRRARPVGHSTRS